jgi:hypothetical protein
MGLDVWFREDVARIMAAVAIARDGLTSDERTLLAAICAGFGISLAEVLPLERRAITAKPSAVMQLPALVEQPAAEEGESERRFIYRSSG